MKIPFHAAELRDIRIRGYSTTGRYFIPFALPEFDLLFVEISYTYTKRNLSLNILYSAFPKPTLIYFISLKQHFSFRCCLSVCIIFTEQEILRFKVDLKFKELLEVVKHFSQINHHIIQSVT